MNDDVEVTNLWLAPSEYVFIVDAETETRMIDMYPHGAMVRFANNVVFDLRGGTQEDFQAFINELG